MDFIWLPLLGLPCLVLGALTGFWMAQKRYKSLLKADNQAKILGFAEKKHLEAQGERVVKLDFESLLRDMESTYRLWTGHKHAVKLGIYLNWIKVLLNKKENTK